MKKRILYAAVLCILLSLAVNGTLAYFTAEDTARNVITSGKVDIAIEEWQQTDAGLIPYPNEPTVLNGGVSMVVFFIVNKIVFSDSK